MGKATRTFGAALAGLTLVLAAAGQRVGSAGPATAEVASIGTPAVRITSVKVRYTAREVVAKVVLGPRGAVAETIAGGGSVWTKFFFLGGPTVVLRRNESNPQIPPRAPIKTFRNSQRINCGATVAADPDRDRYVFTVPMDCAPGAGNKVRAQAATYIPFYSSITPPTSRG